MERYCIAKQFTRADGSPAWGVFDSQTKTFVEGGFFRKGAAQKVAECMNAEAEEGKRPSSPLSIDPQSPAGQAIADYVCGFVIDLQCKPDPQVAGVYALSAIVKVGPDVPHEVQFLLRGVLLQKVTAEDLEEVSFTEWPPVARFS